MRRWRLRATVAVVCVLVIGGAIAAYVAHDGSGGSTPRASAAPSLPPLIIKIPPLPVIAGGIPVDLDPLFEPKDFATSLAFLPGKLRYRLTISNISSLGTIDSFQWYPPYGTTIKKVFSSSVGSCNLTGLKGFGGAQFPTLVLHQSVLCQKLGLKPPTCTCRGDGGSVSISFESDRPYGAGDVDVRVRAATLAFPLIPLH